MTIQRMLEINISAGSLGKAIATAQKVWLSMNYLLPYARKTPEKVFLICDEDYHVFMLLSIEAREGISYAIKRYESLRKDRFYKKRLIPAVIHTKVPIDAYATSACMCEIEWDKLVEAAETADKHITFPASELGDYGGVELSANFSWKSQSPHQHVYLQSDTFRPLVGVAKKIWGRDPNTLNEFYITHAGEGKSMIRICNGHCMSAVIVDSESESESEPFAQAALPIEVVYAMNEMTAFRQDAICSIGTYSVKEKADSASSLTMASIGYLKAGTAEVQFMFVTDGEQGFIDYDSVMPFPNDALKLDLGISAKELLNAIKKLHKAALTAATEHYNETLREEVFEGLPYVRYEDPSKVDLSDPDVVEFIERYIHQPDAAFAKRAMAESNIVIDVFNGEIILSVNAFMLQIDIHLYEWYAAAISLGNTNMQDCLTSFSSNLLKNAIATLPSESPISISNFFDLEHRQRVFHLTKHDNFRESAHSLVMPFKYFDDAPHAEEQLGNKAQMYEKIRIDRKD